MFNIDEIKNLSLIHKNTDNSILNILLKRIENTYLVNLIGHSLFKIIEKKNQNDPDYLNIINENLEIDSKFDELLGFLKQVVAIKLEIDYIIEMSIEYRNLGVGFNNDSQLLPLNNIDYINSLLDKKNQKIESLEQIIKNFINDNLLNFTNYYDNLIGYNSENNFNIFII